MPNVLNEKQTCCIDLRYEKRSTTTRWRFAAASVVFKFSLCKHSILERGFLLVVVNDAP